MKTKGQSVSLGVVHSKTGKPWYFNILKTNLKTQKSKLAHGKVRQLDVCGRSTLFCQFIESSFTISLFEAQMFRFMKFISLPWVMKFRFEKMCTHTESRV